MNRTSDPTFNSFVVKGDLEAIDPIRDYCKRVVRTYVREAHVEDICNRAELAVIESVTNVIRHSVSDEIEISSTAERNSICFEVTYDGEAFQPPTNIADIEFPLEGGMGLFLIQQCVSDVKYRTNPDGRQSVLLRFETIIKDN